MWRTAGPATGRVHVLCHGLRGVQEDTLVLCMQHVISSHIPLAQKLNMRCDMFNIPVLVQPLPFPFLQLDLT